MAVTAWPTILIDSATGSDSQASGAGPATALFGTANASTDATGLIVTLPAGTDTSGVATDGSHVIFLNNTTAGARNFAAINAKAGSGGATPTVTVEQAFAINLTTKDWAIGGKRASSESATSKRLHDNNGGAGDWASWAIELQSGHAESITVPIDLRGNGSITTGPNVYRGKSGAATKPKITATSAINMVVTRGTYQYVQDIELTAGAASMTSGVTTTTANVVVSGITLSRTSTNTFTNGISLGGFANRVQGCEIQRASVGVLAQSSGAGDTAMIAANYVHDCTSHGISLTDNSLGVTVYGNVISLCGGDGINSAFTGTANRSIRIIKNTIDSCTGDGIELSGAVGDGYSNVLILNNELSNNGALGLNLSNGSVTDKYLAALAPVIQGNTTYNNTSGAYKSATATYAFNACPWASGDSGANPTLSTFTPGNTALKGTAYPTTVAGATNYEYPGAVQPNSSAGSVTLVCVTQNLFLNEP